MNKGLLAVMLTSILFSAGCSTTRYAFHTRYRLTQCKSSMDQKSLAKDLISRGYVRWSKPSGPYEIFHKSDIEKKSSIAQEPYEDLAGDIAVAVCPGTEETYLVVEEWRSCKSRRDCTEANQKELRTIAEKQACQVEEKSERSKSWKLEERQDWTKESCTHIAKNLF